MSRKFRLLKPRYYFTYPQAQHSKILLGSYIAFICLLLISEQTATLTLHRINREVLCNRGAECLQRGTDWFLI